MSFWSTGLPWQAVDFCINDRTFDYFPTDEAVTNFRTQMDLQWDDTNDSPSKVFTCPQCQGQVMIPWQEQHPQIGSLARPFEHGSGFTDKTLRTMCIHCRVTITHEKFRIAKFRHDVLLMPGTILSRNGMPENPRGERHSPSFPSNLIQQAISIPLLGLVDLSQNALASMSMNVSPFKMMSRYLGNSSPFALDLIICENPNDMAVPTFNVDLAWHTHQLSPFQYFTYSPHHAQGRYIDHDDKVIENKLNISFQWTSKQYQGITGGQAAGQLHDRADIDSDPSGGLNRSTKKPSNESRSVAYLSLVEIVSSGSPSKHRSSSSTTNNDGQNPYGANTLVWGLPVAMSFYIPFAVDPSINETISMQPVVWFLWEDAGGWLIVGPVAVLEGAAVEGALAEAVEGEGEVVELCSWLFTNWFIGHEV
ncbi:hypothetical protein PAAG_06734 [Paracoccidioides lutzii Pb01]|uniref:Uncharacterized protein n=1 Tax=Paracoccidioides lutzii (strain ATCC MYA-826 / Pb01) TaxID=502779 RepID=C1H7J3_PARBA|nr:hypothetical protein PAAG_06734 [Paracoccidioides lutzii Pb01]EEH36316.2 hypothetical protein PAAG_06734 [Paracoccidioides lutzii Pb01]